MVFGFPWPSMHSVAGSGWLAQPGVLQHLGSRGALICIVAQHGQQEVRESSGLRIADQLQETEPEQVLWLAAQRTSAAG